jgi:hypothetical protein
LGWGKVFFPAQLILSQIKYVFDRCRDSMELFQKFFWNKRESSFKMFKNILKNDNFPLDLASVEAPSIEA